MINVSDIVLSTAGRDSGSLLVVVHTEPGFVLVADGVRRRFEKPKRKKLKHVRRVSRAAGPAAERLSKEGKATNSEIRRMLADHTASPGDPETGGNI